MKTLFCILLFQSYSIPDTLPSKDILFAKIDSLYAIQAQADLLEYKTSKKGNWLKFLPTVGLSYSLDGRLLPTISYSSTILYQTQKEKQQSAVKRQSIIEKNRLTAEKAKAQLSNLLAEYEHLQKEIARKEQLLEIDRQLFSIQQARYDRLEIGPETFLKAKKLYLLEEQQLAELLQKKNLIEIRMIKWIW